jgi:hypothetical protein
MLKGARANPPVSVCNLRVVSSINEARLLLRCFSCCSPRNDFFSESVWQDVEASAGSLANQTEPKFFSVRSACIACLWFLNACNSKYPIPILPPTKRYPPLFISKGSIVFIFLSREHLVWPTHKTSSLTRVQFPSRHRFGARIASHYWHHAVHL